MLIFLYVIGIVLMYCSLYLHHLREYNILKWTAGDRTVSAFFSLLWPLFLIPHSIAALGNPLAGIFNLIFAPLRYLEKGLDHAYKNK